MTEQRMTNEQAISIMTIQRPIRGTAEKKQAYEMSIEALKREALCRKALENTLDEIYDHMCPEVIKDSSGDTHGYYPENYEEYEKMYEIIKGNFKDIYPDLFKGGMYD